MGWKRVGPSGWERLGALEQPVQRDDRRACKGVTAAEGEAVSRPPVVDARLANRLRDEVWALSR